MAVTQKTVNYCVEIDTLLNLIVVAVADVKAGKTAGTVVSDLVPGLVGGLTGVLELKVELADKKSVETTIALKGVDLLAALGL